MSRNLGCLLVFLVQHFLSVQTQTQTFAYKASGVIPNSLSFNVID
jgi:hypothetical protein